MILSGVSFWLYTMFLKCSRPNALYFVLNLGENFVKCEKLFTRRSLSDFLKSFMFVMKQTEWMCELKPTLHGHVPCGAFFFFVLSDLFRFHFDLHC